MLILPKNSEGMTPIVYDGKISYYHNIPEAGINELLVAPLNAKGYNIPSSGWLEELITLQRGDEVPNWDKYQEL